MDNPSYDVKHFTPIEKIAHAFHMEEIWAAILEEYKKIKTNPPSDNVCKCAMDVENNGVLKMLRFTALAIREPQLVYGNNMKMYDNAKKNYNFGYPTYTYHFTLQKSF